MHTFRFLTAFTITLALLSVSAVSHSESETESAFEEELRFRSVDASRPAILAASLKGSERFAVAWRLPETSPEALTFSGDSTAYYQTQGQLRAVMPSGERLFPSSKAKPDEARLTPSENFVFEGERVIKYQAEDDRWSYALPGQRKVLRETLQADERGNIYFQDDARSWYSLDKSGKERFILDLEGHAENTVCKTAPSGDSICASPALGLIGIREKTNAPRLYINGKERFFPVRPEIIDGVTYVPLRSIAEAFGADVRWDQQSQSIDLSKNNRSVRMTIGLNEAIKNGKKERLEQPPLLKYDTTLVPLRFAGEALGEQVIWEHETRTIQIFSS